jgi:hypothetical protein
MPKCRLCAILEETVEKLVFESLDADAEYLSMSESDPQRAEADFIRRSAREALDDATKALGEHQQDAHPKRNAASR